MVDRIGVGLFPILALFLGQSRAQCPSFLQNVHWFFFSRVETLCLGLDLFSFSSALLFPISAARRTHSTCACCLSRIFCKFLFCLFSLLSSLVFPVLLFLVSLSLFLFYYSLFLPPQLSPSVSFLLNILATAAFFWCVVLPDLHMLGRWPAILPLTLGHMERTV